MQHDACTNILVHAGAIEKQNKADTFTEDIKIPKEDPFDTYTPFFDAIIMEALRKDPLKEINQVNIKPMTIEQATSYWFGPQKNSLLIRAILENKNDILKLILQRGVLVSSPNLKKWNALHFAVKQNNVYAISLFLEGEPRRESDLKFVSETEVRYANHNHWC